MTRAAARAPLNSSRLIRFLTESEMMVAAASGQEVGQQLGDWLNFRQAIALHSLLGQAPTQPSATQRHAPAMGSEALHEHVLKVRAALEQSIGIGAAQGSGLSRIDMPQIEWEDPVDPKTVFEPYRRFMAAHQRQMEAVISNLRAQVRSQLSALPALHALAALDAQFENILQEREALLLSKVAKLMEKRFVQALKKHLQNQTDAPDAPQLAAAQAPNTPHWLATFQQTLRSALLAELDTRLQPTLGLLEAFNPENPS
jgi:hypothetical protein